MRYKCIPHVMIRELAEQGNDSLNAFGAKDSVSDVLSPRNIINNLPHVDYNNLKHNFGKYLQLHVNQKVTKTMKSRTIGEIILIPIRIQGQYNYMSLETGKKIESKLLPCFPILATLSNGLKLLDKRSNNLS